MRGFSIERNFAIIQRVHENDPGNPSICLWLRINGVFHGWWRMVGGLVVYWTTTYEICSPQIYTVRSFLITHIYRLLAHKGRRNDLHSDDDREDGLVGGTFTRLLGINNSNNKCKLIILIPFLSSFSVPRLQTVFLATLSSFSVGNSMYKSKCIITIFNILGCGWFRSYKSNFGTLLIFTECSTYGK